jgi:hypothetical protein
MGTSTAKPTGYISGEDPATIEANRVYQDALARLSQSLDTRKNRFFDPVWLAAAQGFLAPTQTGGFGEALGNVAKNVSAAQELDLKQEQEIAQQRMAAAGKGIELQRMRANDANIAKYINERQKGAIAGPQAAAVAGPGAGGLGATTTEPSAGALPAPTGDSLFFGGRLKPEELADFKAGNAGLPTGRLRPEELAQFQAMPKADKLAVPEAPVAARGVGAGQPGALPAPAPAKQALQGALPVANDADDDGGVQIFPANKNFMTSDEYVLRNRFSGKSLGDLLKEGAELERKNLEVKESGTTNLATGMFYPNKSEPVDIQIFSEGSSKGTFKVPQSVALKLYQLQRQGNQAGYKALTDKFIGTSISEEAKALAKKVAEEKRELDKKTAEEERSVSLKEREKRGENLAVAAAAKEAAAEETDTTARRIYGSATRVADYLKASPNYFGIFARPGVTAAVGNLIKEGIQTPTGTLNLAGFEDSMRKLMPGVTQADLDNVTKAAAELAEIELAFTRLYLAKQGAVTEGERKIVRAIPGTTSSSPEMLRSRMELLKARSQYDIDVVDSFRQWQDKNPGRSYLEFERKSDLYKDIKKSFEVETEKIFGGIRAVPSNQRQQVAPAAPAANQPSSGFKRDPTTGVIRRKLPGE